MIMSTMDEIGVRIVLVVMCVVTANSQSIDELIARATFGNRGLSDAAAASGPIFVDGGRAVLKDLDIAVPLPCTTPDPSQIVPAEDGFVRLSFNAPICSVQRRTRKKRNIGVDAVSWGTKTIPYAIVESLFSVEELTNIQAAMDEYKNYTCIQFVPRTTESKYFRIIRDTGCWSYVGYVDSLNPQPLSLSDGCAGRKGIPIHEFFHLIGAFHQQSRSDRDDHVIINLENVYDGFESNFDKEMTDLYNTPYSYSSIMHYGSKAFSKNGLNTITTIDSSKQNVIGNRETFSFEDLQVLNRFLQCDAECPGSSPCLETQYRGKDCQCYCSHDKVVPAIPCPSDPDCDAVNQPCQCSVAKCQSLPNTICASSGACECDNGFELFNGGCVTPASVTCNRANENCLCSFKGSTACSAISDSTCSPESNECKCDPGFREQNGACVAASACTEPGVDCSCSTKGASACDGVANTVCDVNTEACECAQGFFLDSRRNLCVATPECTTTNTNCECSIQGPSACSAISFSSCHPESNECRCYSNFTDEGNRCTPSCNPALISDGSQLSPFNSLPGPTQFFPQKGSEPATVSMFGINRNGYRLHANGTGSDVAILLVPRLTRSRRVRNKRMCISFNLKMTDAKFVVEYKFKNKRKWRRTPIEQVSTGVWGATGDINIFIKKVRNFQMRFRATGLGSGPWEVNVDPLMVRCCT